MITDILTFDISKLLAHIISWHELTMSCYVVYISLSSQEKNNAQRHMKGMTDIITSLYTFDISKLLAHKLSRYSWQCLLSHSIWLETSIWTRDIPTCKKSYFTLPNVIVICLLFTKSCYVVSVTSYHHKKIIIRHDNWYPNIWHFKVACTYYKLAWADNELLCGIYFFIITRKE